MPLLEDFRSGKIKKFYTYKKTRFIIQLLYRNATYYLQYLRMLERSSGKIEQELHKSTRNEELFQLLSLDKSLVYLSNSLRANELVLERLMRLESVKKYPEDEELLEVLPWLHLKCCYIRLPFRLPVCFRRWHLPAIPRPLDIFPMTTTP